MSETEQAKEVWAKVRRSAVGILFRESRVAVAINKVGDLAQNLMRLIVATVPRPPRARTAAKTSLKKRGGKKP